MKEEKSRRWTRRVMGFDESGNRYSMLQRARWDYVYGSGWTRSWEDLAHTKRYLHVREV